MKKIALVLTLVLVFLLGSTTSTFAESRPEVKDLENWKIVVYKGLAKLRDFEGMPYSGRIAHCFLFLNPDKLSDYSFCAAFFCKETNKLLVVGLVNVREKITEFFYVTDDNKMVKFGSSPYLGTDPRFLGKSSISL